MSFWKPYASGDQAPLAPPVTPEERQWWAKERIRFYKSVLLRSSLPFFIVFSLGAVFTKPDKLLWGIPFFALLAFGAGLLQARAIENRQRTREVRWKRIRESILADSPPEQP